MATSGTDLSFSATDPSPLTSASGFSGGTPVKHHMGVFSQAGGSTEPGDASMLSSPEITATFSYLRNRSSSAKCRMASASPSRVERKGVINKEEIKRDLLRPLPSPRRPAAGIVERIIAEG